MSISTISFLALVLEIEAAGCLEVGGTTALATVFVPALEAATCFPVF